MISRGNIVKIRIKESDCSITSLAKKLRISRNTLYAKLEEPHLDYPFIVQIGHVIHYDFSLDFPQIKENKGLLESNPILSLSRQELDVLWKANRKYIHLLEEYANLLMILIKIANQNKSPRLKKELIELVKIDSLF